MLLILQTPPWFNHRTMDLAAWNHSQGVNPFKKRVRTWFTVLYLSVMRFLHLLNLHCFNSSITPLFAQVLGGELKSTRLWRGAHSIYCSGPISKGSARGLAGWVGGRVDRSVSGGRLSSGWCLDGGAGATKQLEHMADCQHRRDLGLLLLTPPPPDLFVYLPLSRFAEGREQAGLEWEWRWFKRGKKKANARSRASCFFVVVYFIIFQLTPSVSTRHRSPLSSCGSSRQGQTHVSLFSGWMEDDDVVFVLSVWCRSTIEIKSFIDLLFYFLNHF